ncbi:hypothetical protein OCL41_06090 [Neisseria gonorrhoeae]|nr:hypothetical protein [Neisseria gonorrhoeae]UXY78996.1 hypothetical protein OCL41_06090 [Neisseria gonorrhoeae]
MKEITKIMCKEYVKNGCLSILKGRTAKDGTGGTVRESGQAPSSRNGRKVLIKFNVRQLKSAENRLKESAASRKAESSF